MDDVRVEYLDHTGDGGLSVTAPSLPRLLTACAEATVRFCCPAGEIRPVVTRSVTVQGHDLVELLVGWLAEINSEMALRHELYGAFRILSLQVDGEPPFTLHGELRGEQAAPERHVLETEIKAVTYHAAFVRETAAGWECRVVFDL